ncbi:DUF2249 domain-containing protein [Schinkia sp. CFF1]
MSQETGKVVELDVREDIKNKQEPFQKIMEAIQDLESGDTFILHAPFQPAPLFNVLKSKGFSNESEQIAEDYWKITFVKQ